uniref:Uncharacterized protein n=2 Tax=Oryza TaxID=4527 RepID=A0A0E0PWM5_ORYRU
MSVPVVLPNTTRRDQSCLVCDGYNRLEDNNACKNGKNQTAHIDGSVTFSAASGGIGPRKTDKSDKDADRMVFPHDWVTCNVALLAAVPVATRRAQPSQHTPAGPSSIGPHEAKQIQHHGHPQWDHGDP